MIVMVLCSVFLNTLYSQDVHQVEESQVQVISKAAEKNYINEKYDELRNARGNNIPHNFILLKPYVLHPGVAEIIETFSTDELEWFIDTNKPYFEDYLSLPYFELLQSEMKKESVRNSPLGKFYEYAGYSVYLSFISALQSRVLFGGISLEIVTAYAYLIIHRHILETPPSMDDFPKWFYNIHPCITGAATGVVNALFLIAIARLFTRPIENSEQWVTQHPLPRWIMKWLSRD